MSMIPTRTWMTSLIADFLEAGTKHDDTAYAPELLSQGWELIKTLLARAEPEPARLTDPMTHALNTEKGRVIPLQSCAPGVSRCTAAAEAASRGLGTAPAGLR